MSGPASCNVHNVEGLIVRRLSDLDQRLVMLIDDEHSQVRLISSIAARAGWRTIVFGASDDALAALGEHGDQPSAIILDHWVAGDDTCKLIAELKAHRPAVPVLVLTASTCPNLAVEAMRAGASDYLLKPVTPDRLLHALRVNRTAEPSAGELQPLAEKLDAPARFESMIGSDPAFRGALARAALAAKGDGCILIEGENGTGKDMLVRAVHAASRRARMPLRVINVRGNSSHGLNSLLFGHEKGAFPGAFETQVGGLQQCDGATLVLDEVNRLPREVQDRLAETITQAKVKPIGAKHSYRIDVRILAASHRPLSEAVAEGQFSAALYAALSATRVELPPLRRRIGDIAALARHFLSRFRDQPGLRELGITDEALTLLRAFEWPGNVRQLQAALFRAAVTCEGDALTAKDFPQLAEMVRGVNVEAGHRDQIGVVLYTEDGHLRPLEEIEADVIRLAVGRYSGRMTEVARRLGIGRSTLYRKLTELGIDNVSANDHS